MSAEVAQNIDKKQVISAVKALQKYHAKAKAEGKAALLEDEDDGVFVSFTLTSVPTNPSPRPQLITLDNPFTTKEHNSRFCVFVKDPAREFKDQIQDLDIPCVAKVIGYDKLKRNFHQYKDKRALLKEYDGFLADLRVYKMLPELLGKEFYSRKKYPCPIKVHGFENTSELEAQLNRATSASQFMLGNGPNYSVKTGMTFQKAAQVADNILQGMGQALAYATVHDDIEFNQVTQVTVRAGKSPELPVYNYFSEQDLKAYST